MSNLLEIKNLVTAFPSVHGADGVRAVNGISFSLDKGKVLGLVGESGSGKSVTGFSIMGLVDPPGRVVSGEILLSGTDLAAIRPEQMRRLRGRHIAMIFQDPMMTLNPVLRIGTQITEALQAHESMTGRQARARAREALSMAGIPSADERLSAYPHEFSGGMRQRVAIAIAMLHRPGLIIADEPTTALDVTIQSQIISQVQILAEEFDTAVIWITHDLAVISRLADEIAVMYAGRLVETGSAAQVLRSPRHPYTRGLIDSVPSQNTRGKALRQIPGITPNLSNLPSGCSFRTRCQRANETCRLIPEATQEDGRTFRCHHPIREIGE